MDVECWRWATEKGHRGQRDMSCCYGLQPWWWDHAKGMPDRSIRLEPYGFRGIDDDVTAWLDERGLTASWDGTYLWVREA